jgi:sugar phosphate permease
MMLGPITAGYAAQVFGFSITFILVGSLALVASVLFYVVRTNTTLGQRDEQRQRVSA